MSDNFFQNYKTDLKLAAAKNLEKTIDKIFSLVADSSPQKNDIILLKVQYQNLEEESIKGVIAETDRVLRTNRLLDNLFQHIDNLRPHDLQPSDDDALNQFLAQLSAKKEKPADTEIESLTAKQHSNPAPAAPPTFEKSKSVSSTVSMTFEDLDLFTEQHRSLLGFYPVVFRDLRSMLFAKSATSDEISQKITSIQQYIPELQEFKTAIDNLTPVIKKIRTDFDNRIYWKQFQQISSQRTSLTLENLKTISEMNKKAIQFEQLLKEKKFL